LNLQFIEIRPANPSFGSDILTPAVHRSTTLLQVFPNESVKTVHESTEISRTIALHYILWNNGIA